MIAYITMAMSSSSRLGIAIPAWWSAVLCGGTPIPRRLGRPAFRIWASRLLLVWIGRSELSLSAF